MCGRVDMCVCMTHEGAEGSALICCIFPLLTERKNIHMIDVFVVLPFVREEEIDGKTDTDVGSQDDQEIDLCVRMRVVCVFACTHVGVHVHRWVCLVFISESNFCWLMTGK